MPNIIVTNLRTGELVTFKECEEIEVTPAMIDAGLHHMLRFNPYRGSDDEQTVVEIFRAMARARSVAR